MLPECRALLSDVVDGSIWTCARSVTFGCFCLATLALGVYGCQRILPVFLSTRWYITNLCMLALSVLQMALLVYECFIQSSSKILVVTKYCRGVQIAIACMLYGKLACDMTQRSSMVRVSVRICLSIEHTVGRASQARQARQSEHARARTARELTVSI